MAEDTIAPKGFQARLADALAKWREKGCAHSEDGKTFCGAAPHRVKMVPRADDSKKVDILVDCAAGHAEQWSLEADAAEIAAEAVKQQEALAKAQAEGGMTPSKAQLDAIQRDPTKATITIQMDMKTQSIAITDAFVPTPAIGAVMALVAQKHFMDQIGRQALAAPAIAVPQKKALVDPRTGRPLS